MLTMLCLTRDGLLTARDVDSGSPALAAAVARADMDSERPCSAARIWWLPDGGDPVPVWSGGPARLVVTLQDGSRRVVGGRLDPQDPGVPEGLPWRFLEPWEDPAEPDPDPCRGRRPSAHRAKDVWPGARHPAIAWKIAARTSTDMELPAWA